MEYDESTAERELENAESQTEQIEAELKELEEKVEELEQAIAELRGEEGGDEAVIASLENSKAREEQEIERVKQEAAEIEAQLAEIDARIRVVDGWNTEAADVLRRLQAFEDVSAAMERVADRERWVEEQDQRCSELRGRIRQIMGGSGHG